MGKVTLRPIELDDTSKIVLWRNSDSVKKNLYIQDELKPEQHIAYYENVVKRGKCSQFMIVVEEEGAQTAVGTVYLKNLDHGNHNGEYGIFIGEETGRGKGYAEEATKSILRYGFETLNLHRIYLTVMSDNIPAVRLYEKCGFLHEGVLRDHYHRSDGYVDIMMMAVLKEDWAVRQQP